jgi:hypothetical protein
MPEEIDHETGSSIPPDSRPLASNLSPAQRQFAEVLGNCLAERWRRMHSAPQADASDRSARTDSPNDKTGD